MTPAKYHELRVHGVGGRQIARLLGFTDDADLFTLPPHQVSGQIVPPDAGSRFVQRIPDDGVQGYEWGTLTTGSLLKALWVVYLPLTIINVAGWAHPPGRHRWRSATVHLLAMLATVTYVTWTAYLLVDLVAIQWRRQLLTAPGVGDTIQSLARGALAPVAFDIFVSVLLFVVVFNARTGPGFEQFSGGGGAQPSWRDHSRPTDPGFFRHGASYKRLRRLHIAVAVVAAGAVPLLAVAGGGTRTRIGTLVVGIAVVQTVLLLVLWVTDSWDGTLPTGTALATLGTVMAHAAFAGTAVLLRDRLAAWPRGGETPIIVGPELGLADTFLLAVAAAALGVCALVAYRLFAPRADATGLVATLARSAKGVGVWAGAAFMIATAIFFVAHIGDVHHESSSIASWWKGFLGWYDGFRFDAASNAQRAGTFLLVALPGAVYLVVKGPYDTGVARMVGNVWDVFTFWPRRFHPFAVPPYSERAVLELRERVRSIVEGDDGLVLSGHSQGSVLALTAVAQLDSTTRGKVRLVTFGSPLRTLIGATFPAYFGTNAGDDKLRAAGEGLASWHSFWRKTDPIGGPLALDATPAPPAWFHENELADPPLPAPVADAPPSNVPPLERPRQWGVKSVHSYYPADPVYQKTVGDLRDP
jgi:hypothetical protein